MKKKSALLKALWWLVLFVIVGVPAALVALVVFGLSWPFLVAYWLYAAIDS